MTKNDIETWLVSSKTLVINLFGLPANWWPTTAPNNPQARASAWGASFFTNASLANAAGRSLTVHCSNGANNLSQQILATSWNNPPNRLHDPSQLMLDFCVTNDGASSPIQVTGESEVSPSFPTSYNPVPANGYAWDFYKLLVVPSATRVFFARVAAHGGVSAPTRVDELANSLRNLVDLYGPAYLRPNDELAAAIVPATTGQRDETIIFWVTRGRVRFEKVTPGIL